MFQKIKKLKMLKNKGIAHIRLEIRVTVEVVLIILHRYYRKLWVTIYTEVDILVLCTYFRMLICHAHFCTQSLSMLSNSNLFWTLCTALFARSPLVCLVIQIYSEHRAPSLDPPGLLAHWNYSKKIFPINWGIPTFVNADLFIIIGIRTYCQRERSSTDWN